MDDEAMNVAVQIEHLGLLPATFRYMQKSLVKFPELNAELCSFCSRQRRYATASNTFKRSDNEIQFVCVFFCQRRDDHTGFADVSMFENVPFALQPVDSAAYGSSAH